MWVLQKFKAQDKLKTFKGVFLKESAVLSVANKVKLSTRAMILSIFLKNNERNEVEFRHNTKTTQKNLYRNLLKIDKRSFK